MLHYIFYAKHLIQKVKEDNLSVFAAQSSFFIVLAAFPFIMLLMSTIQLIPTLSQTDIKEVLNGLFPDIVDSLVNSVIDDLYLKSQAGTAVSITALVALWSASKGILSVQRGFNKIYGIKETRNYVLLRIICAGYTIVFLFAMMAVLVLLVFGNTIQIFIQNHMPIIAQLTSYIISFRTLLSIVLLVIVFAAFYKYLPNRRLSFKSQLPGAVFSTFGWIVFSLAFSIYFNNFSNYSYMYGSLTAIVLLMLWIYCCMCILLFGGELNIFLSQWPMKTIIQKQDDSRE